MIVGDSMIKYFNEREVSTHNSVKVKCHLGVTADDIIDYVRLAACNKPGIITIHTGANDIQNKVNMLEKVRKAITTIKEIDANNGVRIAPSCVINLDDQNFEEEIKETTTKFENIYMGKGIRFMNNSNIDDSCLNRK